MVMGIITAKRQASASEDNMFKLIKSIFKPKEPSTPESKVVVTFDEEWIISKRPGAEDEKVRWSDLKAVFVDTLDCGPFAPDVFWILVGDNENGCVFPQGATGHEDILQAMQSRLSGFDNKALIDAMSCYECNRFLIWKTDI